MKKRKQCYRDEKLIIEKKDNVITVNFPKEPVTLKVELIEDMNGIYVYAPPSPNKFL